MNAAALEMSSTRAATLSQAGTTQSRGATLPRVRGALQYLQPTGERPRSLEFEVPAGVAQTTAVYQEHTVDIRDVRSVSNDLSVDREGFELLTAPSSVTDFGAEEAIRGRYYNEAIALLKETTGAVRVIVFDHTIRKRVPGTTYRSSGAPRQPVPRVHVDYTVKSGPQRVRDWLGDEAEALLRKRFAVINVWRPIHGPILDSPLAVTDARSVSESDLVETDLVYPERTGEIYYVKFNPAHRWYYASAMRDEEVLLIKCYDSFNDGRARFVPHSSFVDPTTPAGAPPRESIELRTLVFFD
jgi:hypothetical protein